MLRSDSPNDTLRGIMKYYHDCHCIIGVWTVVSRWTGNAHTRSIL